MKRLIDIINDKKAKKEMVSTGFMYLDRLTHGFRKSDLIYIGARPAMGKTTFAVNLAEKIASQGRKCAFFSLEMSEEWISKIFTEEKSYFRIFIDDKPIITVSEIKQKVIELENVDLVVIDYFGLIKPEMKREYKWQENQDISRELKIMARELDIPVICNTAIPREVEYAENKRPTLGNFYQLNSLVQDADIIMFLYRDSYYYDVTDEDDLKRTELIVAKNNHGDVATVEFDYASEIRRFFDIGIISDYEINYP